jgi:hypothetical protein
MTRMLHSTDILASSPSAKVGALLKFLRTKSKSPTKISSKTSKREERLIRVSKRVGFDLGGR